MSGAQIGGAIGAVVGFVWGGGNWQLGYAIGSAIGGAVDPTKVYGPKLTDSATQTSSVGVFCPFGYGTFPCRGNVIWQGEMSRRTHKDDGKGSGTEQITYTYHRSYAIRICAGPITGLLKIKRNGKTVYDASTDAQLAAAMQRAESDPIARAIISRARAQNAKFLNNATIYLGDETQLPDPTIEAAEGVGNVSPFRGRAYIVVHDDDVTDLRGAIPQYEFVVSVEGGVSYATPTIGKQTHATSLDTDTSSPLYFDAPQYIDSFGGALWMSYSNPYGAAPGNVAYVGGLYNHDFSVISASSTTYVGTSPGSDDRLWPMATRSDGWCVGTAPNDGFCGLYFGGEFVADLRPTLLSPMSWWSSEGAYSPEFGGLIWFHDTSVYVGVRKTGITPGVTINRIYKWPLANAGGGIVPASFTSPVVTAGVLFYTNVDNRGTARAIALDEGELITYNADLTEASRVTLPMPITGLDAFAVDSGMLFLWVADSQVRVYSLATFELVQTITVTGLFASQNYRMVFTHDSLMLQSGRHIKRVDYDPTCIAGVPIGWAESPDAPGVAVSPLGEVRIVCSAVVDSIAPTKPTLAYIVADLCQRVGLTPDEYDVSQLAGISVDGFRIASEGDPASAIGALAAAYRFDCGEWDGKMRFVLRGGAPVLALGVDDLVERDGDPIEWVRRQEAELLRKVNVAYMDPAADYTPTTQTWERRIATIEAKGEQSSEVPVVMDSDAAATIAEVRGLIAWAETESAKLSLPYRRTALTPTDVILITDTDNTEHRIRLEQIDEDSGVLLSEATLDGGAMYGAMAVGVKPPPRSIPEPGVIGPTTLHVMDLPVWDREAHDELGLYVAARGVLGGWEGASIGVSTDGGATYVTVGSVTVPSNIGYTTTALPAWEAAEYPSVQTVTVYLPEAPATVTRDALLNNRNRAALRNDSGAWEILQYETVIDNGNDSYTLSGLVRGRYATTPGAAASGAAFVLLDETVQFVRAERTYLSQALTVRAVSFGTLPENNASAALTITGQGQMEWPPHMVAATRQSGTNDVTVTWVERRRLGTEIAPFHSKYHSGFRVTYSDGQTYDVAAGVFTHTRNAAPASQTITVQGLNTITGAGQTSEAVTV